MVTRNLKYVCHFQVFTHYEQFTWYKAIDMPFLIEIRTFIVRPAVFNPPHALDLPWTGHSSLFGSA